MFFNREQIKSNLQSQIKVNGNIIGVSLGAGITAKNAEKGGADLILALNSGRFRIMGVSSTAGLLPFANSNDMVMEFASKEILPSINSIPIVFGLCATDPYIELNNYLDQIISKGFSGIVNYPSIGMIDGVFREALEECGISYLKEVEAIRLASEKNIFTIAFVFNEEEAKLMAKAGADIICAHLGVTKGGVLGAKKILSLESCVNISNKIFNTSNEINKDIINVIYGGPINSTIDIRYIYNNTSAMGYFGGSTFERIPSEEYVTSKTREFKITSRLENDDLVNKMLEGIGKNYDYIEFVKEYVSTNYMEDITFNDLCRVLNISRTRLSNLFNEEVGCSFPKYLNKYRINKAIDLINNEKIQLKQVGSLVGFKDYAYFSRVFKESTGMSPKEFSNKP